MAGKKRPFAISEILDNVFRDHPLEKRLREGGVWLVWDEAVGKQVASKAQPVKLNDGTLTVHVASAPWLQQLTFLKDEIRRKVNVLLGDDVVKDIYLKAGVMPKKEKAPAPRHDRKVSAEEKELVSRNVSDIDDEDLRASLESLFLRNLEKK